MDSIMSIPPFGCTPEGKNYRNTRRSSPACEVNTRRNDSFRCANLCGGKDCGATKKAAQNAALLSSACMV
jgi:hypothetical protein